MRKQMTISNKLFLSFGAALFLTLAVSFIAINGIGDLGALNDKLVKVTAQNGSWSATSIPRWPTLSQRSGASFYATT